jgi:hypothetical protein
MRAATLQLTPATKGTQPARQGAGLRHCQVEGTQIPTSPLANKTRLMMAPILWRLWRLWPITDIFHVTRSGPSFAADSQQALCHGVTV